MKNVLLTGNHYNKMKSLFAFTGLVTAAMVLWSVLGYLMDSPSFRLVLPLTLISIFLFLAVGLLKNHVEKKRFEEYLEELKRDRDLQEKLRSENIDPAGKTGRAKVKAYFKDRNVGITWTGASVHGAVPKRNKRRSFLPRNR